MKKQKQDRMKAKKSKKQPPKKAPTKKRKAVDAGKERKGKKAEEFGV